MPKGLKVHDAGHIVHWFECECGHRWEGHSQKAKSLAHRLHARVCNTSELSNTEYRPIAAWKESKAAVVEETLKALKGA